MLANLPERIVSKIIVGNKNSCWYWRGASSSKGYPITRWKVDGVWKNKNVSRLILGLEDRDIYACHSCDNPRCLNPKHLFPGDNSANIKDAVKKDRHYQSTKTHCPSGHEYNEENSFFLRHPGKSGNIINHRSCRICSNARARARYNKQRGKI